MNQKKRVLIKVSGEALKDEKDNSIFSKAEIDGIVKQVKALHDEGHEVCIVVGAGNIWRGKLAGTIGLDPVKADYMGMLGTEINAMALADVLNHQGVKAHVLSNIEIHQAVETYTVDKARGYLGKGEVVVFGGGVGSPFFTTDTCAALRAKEMNCDVIMMGKNGVDGVYDSDPRTNPQAKFLKDLTYDDVLEKNLKVMDGTAVSLLRESNIIIRVFNMGDPDNIRRAIDDYSIGTTIRRT